MDLTAWFSSALWGLLGTTLGPVLSHVFAARANASKRLRVPQPDGNALVVLPERDLEALEATIQALQDPELAADLLAEHVDEDFEPLGDDLRDELRRRAAEQAAAKRRTG